MFNRLIHWLTHVHEYFIIDKGELTSRGTLTGILAVLNNR